MAINNLTTPALQNLKINAIDGASMSIRTRLDNLSPTEYLLYLANRGASLSSGVQSTRQEYHGDYREAFNPS